LYVAIILPDGRPRAADSLRVIYGVGNAGSTFQIMFPRGQDVGQFLALIKAERNEDDLCAVYLDGSLLDNGDMFDDWWDRGAVFRVTDSVSEPPAPLDFSSASVVAPERPPLSFHRASTAGAVLSGNSSFSRPRATTRSCTATGSISRTASPSTACGIGSGVPDGAELLVYLPGGLPFLGGTLRDCCEACGGRVRRHRIYAVLTRPLRGAGTEAIREVCDASAPNARLYLSPLFDSSQRGLVNIGLGQESFRPRGPGCTHTILDQQQNRRRRSADFAG
jgi:hypothetical protein